MSNSGNATERKDLTPWKGEEMKETGYEVEAGRQEIPKRGEGVGRHGVQHAGRRWMTRSGMQEDAGKYSRSRKTGVR